MLQLFFGFIVALAITAALIPLLAHYAPRLALTDSPGPRKVHATPIPRIGGIAMAAGLFATIALTHEIAGPLPGLLCGLAVLLAFGIWDDRATLDYRAKFGGQMLAVALCMALGDVRIESLSLASRIDLPVFVSLPLTFLFLLGVTNAVNLSDGLDGLAGGMALICLCAIALLGASGGDPTVTGIGLIQAGAILGFLRYNTHPARIFMGDAGSQMIGLCIGTLAVLVTQHGEATVAASLPLLLVGVPIIDTLAVMWSRLRAGLSPFSSDRNHLHHRLLALGFGQRSAVTIIYVAQFVLFLLAYALRHQSDLVILGVFALFAAAALGLLRYATVIGWNVKGATPATARSNYFARLAASELLLTSTRWIMIGGLGAYAAIVLANAGTVGADIGVLCGALLVMLLIAARSRTLTAQAWPDRVAAYVALVLLVYVEQTGAQSRSLEWLTWVPLLLAGLAAWLRYLLARSRRFELTPLDVLIVFIAIVVPNLPGMAMLPPALLAGTAKAVVALYTLELLLTASGERHYAPRLLVVLILAALAVRSLMALGA